MPHYSACGQSRTLLRGCPQVCFEAVSNGASRVSGSMLRDSLERCFEPPSNYGAPVNSLLNLPTDIIYSVRLTLCTQSD